MRTLLLGLIFLGLTQAAISQSTVKGRIVDTLEKKNLENAVVSLLKRSDSSLIAFARSDKKGEFFLQKITPGKYLLLVTYPQFADFADPVEIANQPVTDLRPISLTLKSKLLDAVIIKSAGAIRIKGDTTEFVADSFHVKEGATVEELLKKLPGFQVNSKGEITTQGQKVQKVLVDGEEFFGDDPTMATQNISARAVDKVQVYDTKSDQQNLTGITTGTEGKTVNIKLKEDSKKGSFGKAHIGSDFQKLVDAKALYNKFVGKRKFSAYGTHSDVSTGSLNWEDKQKLGIENDFEYDEISGYYYSFNSGDEFSDWSLRGYPNSYTAGVLFGNKWDEDKHGLNLSYRYNRLGTINSSSKQQQNILTEGITYKNQFQNTNGLNQQHVATGKYEWKLDSLTSFKFATALTYRKSDLVSSAYNDYIDTSGSYGYRGTQDVDNHTEKKQADNQLTYRQAFKKKNRLFIAMVRFGYIEDDQNSIIKTNTNYYDSFHNIDSTDNADQEKRRNGDSRTIGTKLTWSEPISNNWTLVLDYSYNKNNSSSYRNTYDTALSGKYEVLDTVYSNNFDLDAFSHAGSAILRYTDKKIRAAFGTGIASSKLNLFDIDSNYRTQYIFTKLTPQASFSYSFGPQTRLSLNYRGTTRQPTIDQLQPIRDNSDRQNIFIGNPDLKAGFSHNINLNYNTYKMLSQTGLFIGGSYNILFNSITFYNTFDIANGSQTYMPVNVNGNRNWNLWGNYFKDGQDKPGYGINLNANGGRNINFVNGAENTTTYMNSNLQVNFHYYKEGKFGIDVGPKIGYNSSQSTLQSSVNANYWNYGAEMEGNVTLPGKFEFSTDVNMDLRQHLNAFAGDPNQTIWNASLAKKVFKDKSGKIYLMANDILDQRKGFNRNITSNFISEERYWRISRYFLLKFEWSFNKMPGQEKK